MKSLRYYYKIRHKFIIVMCVIILSISLLLMYNLKNNSTVSGYKDDIKINRVCFRENCFNVSLALSVEERERGLMGKEKFGDNEGMLFVFAQEDRYGFWMKNMKFPIDIIWLDSERKVVDIKENAEPCSEVCETYYPKGKAKYVLEVKAGMAREIDLNFEDKAEFGYSG